MSARYAFLDTNTFLHGRPFDQIDWPAVLGAETVALVLAGRVLSELNVEKDTNRSSTLKDRARARLARIEEIRRGGEPATVRPGVTLEVYRKNPGAHIAAHDLDPGISDDYILATILRYREEYPDRDLLLVSTDGPLRMHARDLGITAIDLPPGTMLEPEPDSRDVEIRELRAWKARQEARRPQPAITFTDGEIKTSVSVYGPERPTSREALEPEVDEIMRTSGPQVEMRQDGWLVYPRIISPPAFLESEEDRTKRKERLIGELRARYAAINRQRRSVTLPFRAVNDGTAVANNVEIVLSFPAGLVITLEEEWNGPQRVKLDPLLHIWTPGRNVSPAQIEMETPQPRVRFGIRTLAHGRPESLDPLRVTFDSLASAESFAVRWTLMANELPEPATGDLHVVVRREDLEE